MKKLFLATAVALFGFVGLNAQSTGIQAGAYVGFPIGDASDVTDFNFGAEVAYYWNVAENFNVGALTGYDHWTAKSIDVPGFGSIKMDDLSFIPLAATAKYDFNGFFVGADIGYAIGVSTGNDGGFLYRPKVGWNNTSFDAYAFYKGISDDGSISSIGAGFNYKF